METRQDSKLKWTLGAEAFAKFLTRLDPDSDRAGAEYERLHLLLVKFFDWRGAHFPEDCADETINRVIRKIDRGEPIQDIRSYCHGVARLVYLETRKKSEAAQVAVPAQLAAAQPEPDADEGLKVCFDQCLAELPQESLQMILQYYSENRQKKIDGRKQLAEKLGIPQNALRSRALRVRKRLEECIERCIKN